MTLRAINEAAKLSADVVRSIRDFNVSVFAYLLTLFIIYALRINVKGSGKNL